MISQRAGGTKQDAAIFSDQEQHGKVVKGPGMKGMSTSQIIIDDSDSASDYKSVGVKKRGKVLGQKGNSARVGDKSANDDVSVTNQFNIKKINRNPEQLRLQTQKTITGEGGEYAAAVASATDQNNKASVVANRDPSQKSLGQDVAYISKSVSGEHNTLSAK